MVLARNHFIILPCLPTAGAKIFFSASEVRQRKKRIKNGTPELENQQGQTIKKADSTIAGLSQLFSKQYIGYLGLF